MSELSFTCWPLSFFPASSQNPPVKLTFSALADANETNVNWLIDWLIDGLIDWMNEWMNGWMDGWIDWLSVNLFHTFCSRFLFDITVVLHEFLHQRISCFWEGVPLFLYTIIIKLEEKKKKKYFFTESVPSQSNLLRLTLLRFLESVISVVRGTVPGPKSPFSKLSFVMIFQ